MSHTAPMPGMVLVPRELTDEMAEAIAGAANCCGGIAYDIWEAVMAVAAQPVPSLDNTAASTTKRPDGASS